MEINATLVKTLREKTGVGLMNCKKALTEANGDIDQAIKYLREKGIANASKKSDRSATEGRVFIESSNDQSKTVMIELNCETDFVASNEDFSKLGKLLARFILDSEKPLTIESLQNETIQSLSFTEFIAQYVLKLGENITLKQFDKIESEVANAAYIHMNGKIGVVVGFSGNIESEVSKSIAMHIAAASPSFVRTEEVPELEINSEKEIISQQAKNEGRPEKIIEKIVSGKIQKYFKEVCLLEQAYIIDDKKSVKQVLPNNVTVTKFFRYSLG